MYNHLSHGGPITHAVHFALLMSLVVTSLMGSMIQKQIS